MFRPTSDVFCIVFRRRPDGRLKSAIGAMEVSIDGWFEADDAGSRTAGRAVPVRAEESEFTSAM